MILNTVAIACIIGQFSYIAASNLAHEDRQVVRPRDHGKALLNPNMGWNYAYFTDNGDAHYGGARPVDDTLDWFPGCNCVYFRVGWGRIEREEGKYNWDYTDRVAKHWIAKGKQTAYCWIALSTTGSESCTPLWLKDAGARCWEYKNHRGETEWIPYWDDPVYLEKLERFLTAAAKRYDGKPWVQFIEIGSLGTWGEGHDYTGRDDPHAPKITLEIQKTHLDLWRRCFPNTQLIVNDDYNMYHDGGVEYALELGYGMADWSIMVRGGEDYKGYHSEKWAELVWREQPNQLENEHYGLSMRRNFWGDGSRYLNALEEYHASTARIHWWPDEFLNGNGADLPGNRELVDKMNLRMGYRLQIVEASWPTKIQPGDTARVDITLRNGGVAPCYQGGNLAVSLIDADGHIVAQEVDNEFDVKSLDVADSTEKATPVMRQINLIVPHSLSPGTYSICVSVGTEDGNPVYALPIEEYNKDGRYRLGQLDRK